ncbi:MAG TPA: GNAT family N-acetyltransferase [Dehalococcoidia bacterium]|nr:GNAT family N-acetyltransferase [Dehalococcoidia bacterium]
MTEADTLAGALAAGNAWLELGCDVIDTPYARIVHSPSGVRQPFGFVLGIRAGSPREIDALFAEVDRALAGCPITYRVAPQTPSPFEARLALEGWSCQPLLLMLLEGTLSGSPPPCDVRPVETDDTWRDWFVLNAENRPEDDSVARSRQHKCPPVRYWQAYVDDEPAGFFSAWEGIDGIGVTENLHVREQYRRGGVATALVHRCVEDARARGGGAITLGCNPDDWPKTWYARLGFRPIGMARIYTREAPTPPTAT